MLLQEKICFMRYEYIKVDRATDVEIYLWSG